MENDQENSKEQPDLHRAGPDDIGSPLNTGHQNQQTTGTNDQNGDVKAAKPLQGVPGLDPSHLDNRALDGRTADGINDPKANETPHPGADDGAPKPAGG